MRACAGFLRRRGRYPAALVSQGCGHERVGRGVTAASSCRDDNGPFLKQPLYWPDFEDLLRKWRSHHAAPLVPVLLHCPAFVCFEALRVSLRIYGPCLSLLVGPIVLCSQDAFMSVCR